MHFKICPEFRRHAKEYMTEIAWCYKVVNNDTHVYYT